MHTHTFVKTRYMPLFCHDHGQRTDQAWRTISKKRKTKLKPFFRSGFSGKGRSPVSLRPPGTRDLPRVGIKSPQSGMMRQRPDRAGNTSTKHSWTSSASGRHQKRKVNVAEAVKDPLSIKRTATTDWIPSSKSNRRPSAFPATGLPSIEETNGRFISLGKQPALGPSARCQRLQRRTAAPNAVA